MRLRFAAVVSAHVATSLNKSHSRQCWTMFASAHGDAMAALVKEGETAERQRLIWSIADQPWALILLCLRWQVGIPEKSFAVASLH